MGVSGRDLDRNSLFRRTSDTTTPAAPVALAPDLVAYREVVAEVLREIAANAGGEDVGKAEAILADRMDEPELAVVLAATPRAMAGIQDLLFQVRNFRPNPRSSTVNLITLIRMHLLSQIEVAWWGHERAYVTDSDVLDSADLVDLDALRRRGLLGFRYRRQPRTLMARASRAAARRVWPNRTPHTAGLLFACARPEIAVLLNRLAAEFARTSPAGTPPLWVTSLARSIEHQHRLRSLGYTAMLPSSHCVGTSADIEMSWFRRFGARSILAALLLERQGVGDINIIDEGQVWHVCVSPVVAAELRREFEAEIGD